MTHPIEEKKAGAVGPTFSFLLLYRILHPSQPAGLTPDIFGSILYRLESYYDRLDKSVYT